MGATFTQFVKVLKFDKPLEKVGSQYSLRNPSCCICAFKMSVQSSIIEVQPQADTGSEELESSVDAMPEFVKRRILCSVDPDPNNLPRATGGNV